MAAMYKDPFLMELFSTPTAPFREHLVRACVSRYLDRARLPYFEDEHGNLVVGVANALELKREIRKKSRTPIGFFVAHMDHPGFHLSRKLGPARYAFRWHGGGPLKSLRGASVFVSNLDGVWGRGRIVSAKLHKSGRWCEGGTLEFDDARVLQDVRDIRTLFGGLHFGSFARIRGHRLYTKAADDLAGVYSLVRSFVETRRAKKKILPIGLLTVGEEVGWVGALAHFESETAWGAKRGRDVFALSLEASRTLDRALIGYGPVVRLGDKKTIFDPELSRRLIVAARRATKRRFQQRVMDGGTCEGTVTAAWSLPTVALCVPLGNYHNQSLEGGPGASRVRQGPAPEFVDVRDLEGLVAVCREVVRAGLQPGDANSLKSERAELLKSLEEYRRQLRFSREISRK